MSGGTYCNLQRSMGYIRRVHRRREKIQALALAKDCYTTKLELLTNATVVDDAIKFVAGHTQKNQHKDNNDKLINEIRNEDIEKEITPATTKSSTSNSIF